MHLENYKATVVLEASEIRMLMLAIQHNMERSVESYYENFDLDVWHKQEVPGMRMFSFLAGLCGMSDHAEYELKSMENKIAEAQRLREATRSEG